MTKETSKHDEALLRLRAFGLAYPGAHTKSPWPGHMDLAVDDKTFAYLSLEGEPLALSCKLPRSCEEALMLPGAKPTPYGLGKWGWVSIQFEKGADIPIDMLEDWIDESYRSQAPKRRLRALEAGAGSGRKPEASATKPKSAAKTASAKKASAKKAAASAKTASAKSAAKKGSAKKPSAKKGSAKKSSAKKSSAKKSSAKTAR